MDPEREVEHMNEKIVNIEHAQEQTVLDTIREHLLSEIVFYEELPTEVRA